MLVTSSSAKLVIIWTNTFFCVVSTSEIIIPNEIRAVASLSKKTRLFYYLSSVKDNIGILLVIFSLHTPS